jgi:hypothetical protein
VRNYHPEALRLQAQALLGLARLDAARDALRAAQAEAERLGQRRTLWEILARRAELEARSGDAAATRRFRQAARAEIDRVAAALPPALRAAFVNLPAARSVLESDPGSVLSTR